MVLETHDGLVERKPTREQRAYRFAVTAAARIRPQDSQRLLPGIFGEGANAGADALAFSQAETYHMADDGANPRPHWRLWSFAGWHWQPRLTLSRALPDVLDRDPRVHPWFQDAGVNPDDPLDLLIQH